MPQPDKQRTINKREADKAEAQMGKVLRTFEQRRNEHIMPRPCRMIHAPGMHAEHYHDENGQIIEMAA